jgi:hypothetical protein
LSDQSEDAAKAAHELRIRQAERAHDRLAKLEDMFNENADRHAHAVIVSFWRSMVAAPWLC